MRGYLPTPSGTQRERALIFSSETLGIPDNKSVQLAAHRIVTPVIAQQVLNVGFDPRDISNWPAIRTLDKVADIYEGTLRSAEVKGHQFFNSEGRRISVHEFDRGFRTDRGSVIRIPTSIYISPQVRADVLSKASKEANIEAHTKALNFYRQEKAGIHFYPGVDRVEDREKFARVVIEGIYQRRILTGITEGEAKNAFEVAKPTEAQSRRELKRILKDIDEKADGSASLRHQLIFNVFTSINGVVPSEADQDMGMLPELLKAEFWKSAAVPLPIAEIVPGNYSNKVLKDATVQDGWNVMLNEPEEHVADTIPAFEDYLTKKQPSQEFEKIIIFGDSPHGGVVESNGINIMVQRTDNPRSKDTVSAIAVDKKGFVHIYDCYTKEGKPHWKKVGVIETKKAGENHTEVLYRPRSKSEHVFPNRMYTYSSDLSPGSKRKELKGRQVFDTRKAAVVIYPRNNEYAHDKVDVSLLHDSEGLRLKNTHLL